MGYTYDTQMSQFINPAAIIKTAGTWTDSASGGVVKSVRTAAAATFNLIVPVEIESNAAALKGCRLKSIEVYYNVATAALNSVTTVELQKTILPASFTANATSGITPTVNMDGLNDTSAKRLTVGDHALFAGLAGAVWIDDNDAYYLYLTFDAAAGTVFTLYGARINYEFRI